MQLQYYLLPPNGAPYVLGDDTGAPVITLNIFQWGATGKILEGFCPAPDSLVQITPLARAPYQFVAPRYNFLTRLRFSVTRVFATAELADSFMTSLNTYMPVQGELAKTEFSTTGTQRSYLRNAIATSRPKVVKHGGVMCVAQYEFVAGNDWSSTP